jgi:ankyrin repeat protein
MFLKATVGTLLSNRLRQFQLSSLGSLKKRKEDTDITERIEILTLRVHHPSLFEQALQELSINQAVEIHQRLFFIQNHERMLAAANDDDGLKNILLEASTDVNLKDTNGQNAFHGASCIDHTEVMKLLLAAGMDVNVPGRLHDRGTPLYSIVIRNLLHIRQ